MQAVSRVVWVRDCISLPMFPLTGVAAVDLGALHVKQLPPHIVHDKYDRRAPVTLLLIEIFVFKTRYPFPKYIYDRKNCNKRS